MKISNTDLTLYFIACRNIKSKTRSATCLATILSIISDYQARIASCILTGMNRNSTANVVNIWTNLTDRCVDQKKKKKKERKRNEIQIPMAHLDCISNI